MLENAKISIELLFHVLFLDRVYPEQNLQNLTIFLLFPSETAFFFLFDKTSKKRNPQIHSREHNCWSDQFCPSIQFLIKFCTRFFSIDFKSFVFIKVRTESHCHKSGKAKLTCTKLLGNSKVEAIFLRNLILSSN